MLAIEETRLHYWETALGTSHHHDLFYLRVMLFVSKRPCSFEDSRTVVGTLYFAFWDACFAMRFLHDDKEYINVIK